MVFNILNNITRSRNTATKASSLGAPNAKTPNVPFGREVARGSGFQIIDPAASIKTDFYSRQALNFINAATNEMSVPYTEQQLLGAYLTSVYMFSALRRVANLISRVKVIAEINEDGKWVRAPETVRINQIFSNEGAEVLSRMWLNYAVYGAAAVFKTKTRRSIFEEQAGRPIYDYKDGAVAGLYVIDKPMWDLDEDVSYGKIRGMYVNQYNISDDVLGSRNYIDRREFVYVTDWNPENPNRGKSIVAVAIHEAVANAAIAQWMSEYFTRGAMPFIMVSMEDDPAMMSDADLRKIKRQFEEYWQGIGSSLRSIFFDRKVNVEQVGISADEVGAPDLNDTALEGIAAAVGLDRELVVTPSGGSQERHDALIMRAWNDTVKPMAEKFLVAFNKDLGLPPNMRLTLDLSDISELEADRQDKSDTEMGIYEGGLQDYNETRQRLKMTPVAEFDRWYQYDGKPMPIEQIVKSAQVPPQSVVDYATTLWDGNLAKRSEVLALVGRQLPADARDGYKYDIEESFDFVTGLWEQDLLTRSQVLGFIGYTMPSNADDGYRSELERGKDFGDFITGLWSDNLLTRSQALSLLNMGLSVPENAPDGYADEIGDRRQNVLDLWGENLMTRKEAMQKLGILNEQLKFNDGFKDDLDAMYDREQEGKSSILDYWDKNLLTRNDVLDMLKLPKEAQSGNGFIDEIAAQLEQADKDRENLIGLWGENLLRKSDILSGLGYSLPKGVQDGYQQELDIINEALAEKLSGELTATEEDGGGDGGGGENGQFRSITDDYDPSPIPYRPAGWNPFPPSMHRGGNSSNPARTTKVTTPNLPTSVPIDGDVRYTRPDDEDDWIELMGDYGYTPNAKPSELLDEFDELLPPSQMQVYNDPFPTQGRQNREDDIDYLDEDDDLLAFSLTPDRREDIEEAVMDELLYGFLDESILRTGDDEEPDERAIIAEAFSNALLEPADTSHPYYASSNQNDQQSLYESVQDNINTIYQQLTGTYPKNDIMQGDALPKANPLYASLNLSGNADVTKIQDGMKVAFEGQPIDYVDPSLFHITLAYAYDVNDADVNNIIALIPKLLSAITLKVGPITTLENDEGKAIVVEVEDSTELSRLQQGIIAAFNAKGVAISKHTNLDNYRPHITLAYASSDFQFEGMDVHTVVRPTSIYFSRDGYAIVNETQLPEHNEYWDTSKSEMLPREKYEDSAHLNKVYREGWKQTLKEPLHTIMTSSVPSALKDALSEYNYSQQALNAAAIEIDKGSFDNDSAWANGENPIAKYLEVKTVKLGGKSFQKTALDELRAWKKVALRNGLIRAMRFENVVIDAELSAKIRSALSETQSSDIDAIRSVFDAAEYAVTNRSVKRVTRESLERWAAKFTRDKFHFDKDEDIPDGEEADND